MFVVTKRYGRTETRVGDFTKEQDAVKFIMEKLQEDRNFKLIATYGLYEGVDLLKEYTQDNLLVSGEDSGTADTTSASKTGSGKSFAPTPFNTAPRLGPQTWIKDTNPDNENDENKDK
jgi:hypothetical protein